MNNESMITIQYVKDVVESIESITDDDERAHAKEYYLRRFVLEEIANGHPDAQKLAKEALETEKLGINRWGTLTMRE